jgi:hypothetical protein
MERISLREIWVFFGQGKKGKAVEQPMPHQFTVR